MSSCSNQQPFCVWAQHLSSAGVGGISATSMLLFAPDIVVLSPEIPVMDHRAMENTKETLRGKPGATRQETRAFSRELSGKQLAKQGLR